MGWPSQPTVAARSRSSTCASCTNGTGPVSPARPTSPTTTSTRCPAPSTRAARSRPSACRVSGAPWPPASYSGLVQSGSCTWRTAASGPGSAPATRSSASRVPSLVTFAAYSRQNRPTNVPDERASRLALGRPHRLALQLPVRQPLAQDLLVELADARLRHLVDERDLVRQPPARHARCQVVTQLVGRDVRPLTAHHACQRPLLPALVRL